MRSQGLNAGDIVKCDGYRGSIRALKIDEFRVGIVTRTSEGRFHVDWLFGYRFNYNQNITRAATREYFVESSNDPGDNCNYVRLHCEAL